MAKKAKEEEATPTEVTVEVEAPPAPDYAERVGQRLGNFTTRSLRGVLRAVGRVREEAEDVWAEAQALRRRE